MQLTVQLHLQPDDPAKKALLATMERFNEAANWVGGELFTAQIANKIEAQNLLYKDVRAKFDLSAQMAILCIHRVCEAFKRDKTIRPTFRPHAAITYDIRIMSFKGIDRVSLLTLSGRVVVPFVAGKYQRERFCHAKKQADLVLRSDGQWFLLVSVVVPDGTPIPVTDFIGIDLGIASIATDSDPDSEPLSGKDVEGVRRKHNLQRKRLQRKGSKGAKKKLVRVSRKESRFRNHTSHVVAKKIVECAKRTGRGIALENLKDIRLRITARGTEARNRLSGWGFAQLAAFIAYKATLAGVKVIYVDPHSTSQRCAECGHTERSNRKSQSEFVCKSCGHTAHADKNAARNIRLRAQGENSKPPLELDRLPLTWAS